MNKRVLFRVDANSKIGGGHLYRCIILATELKKRKHYVAFYSNLEGDFSKWLKDNDKINDIDFKKNKFDVIIFDGYHYDINYINNFIKDLNSKIVLIDDYADKNIYKAELIINPNFYEKSPEYNNTLHKAKILTGFEYVIISDEILKIKNLSKINTIKNILVTFGNSDPDDYSYKLLNRIIDNLSYTFNFVIGNLYQNDKIFNVKKKNSFLYPSNTLYEHYKYSDLAIIAGGNTLWELLYLNIPVISLSRNLFQEKILRNLDKKRVIIYCENICNLFQIITDENFQNKVGEVKIHARNIIDGKGKERIVNEIINL